MLEEENMFSSVLDCPACSHRFHYEHQTENIPDEITCPECGRSSSCEDFSALLFCPHCRSKLKVPLNLLHESSLMCPRCNGILNDNSVSLNEEDYESTYDGHGHLQSFQRMLRDGEIFDKFRVVRLIGCGGMAEVYQAEHLLLKQRCALKLMRNNGASSDPVFIKRFLREAKLSHSLNHPNIVKVFDVGNDVKTGYFFIAMEYIEGQTLQDLSRQGRLSEETLKTVLYSMGNALQVLADAQVVHRDIKPSNIMRDGNGVFKLMDLGIAKSSSNYATGEMTLTMEQSTMGTPSYASPEQCRSAHSVDIRSDIYSLGAAIYHAASGKLPFDGSTAVEIILKVVQGEAEPLKNLRPDLSEDFLDLIDRMMKKDPAERPESPAALINMLAGAGTRRGWLFKRKTSRSSGKKSEKLAKRVRGIIKFLVCIVLLAVIAVNGGYLYRQYKNSSSVAPPVAQTGNILSGLQPMMSYPDSSGEITVFSRWIDKKRYPYAPSVTFAAIEEKYRAFEYDFLEKSPPEDRIPSRLIHDGVAHLDEKLRNRVASSPIHYSSFDEGFTIVLGFQIPEAGECDIVNKHLLQVKIYNRRLLIISGKLYALIDWEIPAGQWINVTISADADKRKLMVFADNVFLGSYLLDKWTPASSYVNWNFPKGHSGVGYKLSYVKAYNWPLEVDVWAEKASPKTYSSPQDVKKCLIPDGSVTPPGKQGAVKAAPVVAEEKTANPVSPAAAEEKTAEPVSPAATEVKAPEPAAPFAAEVKKNESPRPSSTVSPQPEAVGKMTLQEQLSYNWKRYHALEKVDRQAWASVSQKTFKMPAEQGKAYRQILQSRKQLLVSWRNRLKEIEERNKKIAAAKNKDYDGNAGRKFQLLFREFTEDHRSWGYNHETLQESRKMLQLFTEKMIDPNLSVEDSTHSRFNGALIFSLSSGRIPHPTDFLSPLVKRFVDPSPLADAVDLRSSFYMMQHSTLVRYGLPTAVLSRVMGDILKKRQAPFQTAVSAAWMDLCQIIFFDGQDYTGAHLREAVLSGQDEFVSHMLAAGADPNWQDGNGEHSLFATYQLVNGEHIRGLLLAAGADPGVRNKAGKTARDYAYMPDFLKNWENGNLEACRKLLDGRIFPDMDMANGHTLLTDACRKLNLPAIKLLIQHSAEPDKVDQRGMSPMGELFEHLQKCQTSGSASRSSSRRSTEDSRYKDVYEAIRILLNAGSDLRKNSRGFNFLYMFAMRYSDLPESEAMMLFMVKHAKNFSAANWRSFSSAIQRNKKWSPRTKQRIYSVMPPEFRPAVK